MRKRGIPHRTSANRPAWASAVSAAATAAITALAIGSPMAYATGLRTGISPGADVSVVASPSAGTSSPSASTPTATPSPTLSSPSAAPGAPSIAPSSQTVTGIVGRPLTPSDVLLASGFNGTPALSIEPSLPRGLSFDNSTGSISGIPLVADPSTEYIVTADDGNAVATATVTMTITAGVTATILPAIQTVKAFVDQAITPTKPLDATGFGGTPLYTVTPVLPSYFTLDPVTGVIAGMGKSALPRTTYTITGTDGTLTADITVEITVAPRLSPLVQSVVAPTNAEMTPTAELVPFGFVGAVSYSVLPKLPDGLALDTATGVVSGMPSLLVSASEFLISATDGTLEASSTLTLTTTCPTVYTPAQVPSGCPAIPAAASSPGGVSALAAGAGIATYSGIHSPSANPSSVDSCARCHRVHTASAKPLLVPEVSSTTDLCLTCHTAGLGAPLGAGPDVATTWNSPPLPANVDTAPSRAYYSHNIANPSLAHVTSTVDDDAVATVANEFDRQLLPLNTLNRHAECTDCHNPHSSFISAQRPESTLTQNADLTYRAWSLSGRDFGVPGVSVTNSAPSNKAGAAPTYTFLDGTTHPLTAEYQLCFKCHSSFTNLPSNTGFTSGLLYDKGVEFNPNNASFHPVEAAGTNQTQNMQNSLTNGDTNLKYWQFTTKQTIRCTNCHASGVVKGSGAGQIASPHGSANRGILPLQYVTSGTPDTAKLTSDYSLCFACHSEQPFTTTNSSDTNFGGEKGHRFHMNEKVRCSECHGQLHSTTNSIGDQGLSRLLDFPTATGTGTLWTAQTDASGEQNGGTCALTCHDKKHENKSYTYTP